MEYIEIIARDDAVKNRGSGHSLQEKGECGNSSNSNDKVKMIIGKVPLATLSQSLSDFSAEMDTIFENSQSRSKHLILDEIEVSLDVNASGGIRLIGSLEAEASGGIKLKFKRK